MFTIRNSQMEALRRPILQRFEDEMLGRLRDEHPLETLDRGDDELRALIREGMAGAGARGLVRACDVALDIEARLVRRFWGLDG